MARRPMNQVVQSLRAFVGSLAGAEASDQELLDRFLSTQDDSAFETLVRRHAVLVHGVCRRILQDDNDVDDAFQASFLVLFRKADSIRKHRSFASWLHGVARRTALEIHKRALRQRTRERQVSTMAYAKSSEASTWNDLRPVLDEELSGLPEKYRLPLVLCYLGNKTNEEAARELGWPSGSMSRRLEKGKEMLRRRLSRRGVSLSAAALTALLSREVVAQVPTALIVQTVRGVVGYGAGEAFGRAGIIAVADAAIREMAVSRMQVVAACMACVLCMGAGGGWYLQADAGDRSGRALADQKEVEEEGLKSIPPYLMPYAVVKRPLQVLIFSHGANRDFQFTRQMFFKEANEGRADVGEVLQTAPRDQVDSDPLKRLMRYFPSDKEITEKGSRYDSLRAYTTVLAFDPDWSLLGKERQRHLDKWVREGGGSLVYVAGRLHAPQLAEDKEALKIVRDLLPVVLDKQGAEVQDANKEPWRLKFVKESPYFQLDADAKKSAAAWEDFFGPEVKGVKPPDAEQIKAIASMIERLGNEDFKARKEAEEQLSKIGIPALEQLKRAVRDHDDLETRTRAAKLVKILEEQQAKLEFKYVSRGFYGCQPVRSVKEGATVVATFGKPGVQTADGSAVPYFAWWNVGKGKVLYIGSCELWRLRQGNEKHLERLLKEMATNLGQCDLSPLPLEERNRLVDAFAKRKEWDVDLKMFRELVAQLDDREFDVREKAEKAIIEKIDAYGPAVAGELTKEQHSVEIRRRLERVLEQWQLRPISQEDAKMLRTLKLLSEHETPKADKLLRAWANMAAGKGIAKEARKILNLSEDEQLPAVERPNARGIPPERD